MKKIILNTKEADETSADKKNYKYYFNKPLLVKDKSTLSLQSVSQIQSISITPTSSGLIHIGGLTPLILSGVPSNYGWSLNAGGFVEEMEVDLTNSSEVFVTEADGFTLKTAGVDYFGGRLKCLIYNDTTTTFPSPQTLLVISEVMDMGSNFQVGWLIGIRKRPTGVSFTGVGSNPVFQITSIKDSSINQGGKTKYQEQVASFNPIFYQYAGEAIQSDANFTSGDLTLGQGLELKMGTNGANPTLIEVKSITDGGFGYGVGDYIYVNKASFLPATSGTQFLLPVKLQVISVSNNSLDDPARGYKIKIKNLLNDASNLVNSDMKTDLLVYNKENLSFINSDEKIHYKICDIPPQVLMGMELEVENFDGTAPITGSDFILDLKIS